MFKLKVYLVWPFIISVSGAAAQAAGEAAEQQPHKVSIIPRMVQVLKDFSLTVKAATLIFISGRG